MFSNCIFGSVKDIIEHYRKEQIVEGYNLKDPVPNQVFVQIYNVINNNITIF